MATANEAGDFLMPRNEGAIGDDHIVGEIGEVLGVTESRVSQLHARVYREAGSMLIEDLGSTNGTYLDRQKVTRPMPVPVGVPIRIGKTVLELRR